MRRVQRRLVAAPALLEPALPDEAIDEIVLLALRIARVQRHVAARAGILAGAAGNGEGGVAGIEERTLDRDLAVGEHNGPEAFPGLARNGPDAPAVVGADLVLVLLVIDLIR